MPLHRIDATLTDEFNEERFLNLAGQIAGDKLGAFVTENIPLPAAISNSYKPDIRRGSSKGADTIGIYAVRLPSSTIQNGFKIRRKLANAILNSNDHNDAIVAFYSDEDNKWRLGFIRGYKYDALESLREFQVGKGLAVRTASDQLANTFTLPPSTEIGERSVALNKAFSVEAVSDTFYDKFKKVHFDRMVLSITEQGETKERAEDLVVLFTVRIMFLGFVQRKGWLADDQDFLKNLLQTYKQGNEQSGFYDKWLKPLFFEALNGFGAHITATSLPDQTKEIYQMLPYLNGGLFHLHDVDKRNYNIDDSHIESFFTFLFSYNFTIEENTLQEQSLELNPELLGIIFERLVNKQNGAVYTPRTEVDFMCRISIVKWLQQNLENDDRPDDRDLFELFFREKGGGKEFDDDQKTGSFSANQKLIISDKLKSLAICDPAVGSGAFPVGMMQVLNEALENLGEDKSDEARYERKKHIIGRNLYGVEVNEWAVWICQLRLWLSLFIDAPKGLRQSFEPILPSLDFKILQGDSLVQSIGSALIPIEGHAAVDASLKRQVTKLRNLKADFYNNKLHTGITLSMIHNAEVDLTRAMIVEQRDSKRRDLQLLLRKETISQQSLLDDEPERVIQQTLGEAEERERLEEITKLESMLNSLPKEPKTIWSISYAEVFAEKGGFDIVIGNPPYIRQESIEDPLGILKKFDYKQQLAEVIRQDYYPTKDFSTYKKRSGYNAQSDLCVYFYMHTLKLLNTNGIHTFICSNSWLDVGYGVWMQNFLLERVQLHGIYDSHGKRTFANADVNTIISVLGAPQRSRPKLPYKFVAFRDSFEQGVITENLLEIEKADTITKSSDFRVSPLAPAQLLKNGTEENKYIGDKWGGKYLRAPDIFFTIQAKGQKKLVKLRDVAGDLKRGITTGANAFFYLQVEKDLGEGLYFCKNSAGWEGIVESRFLKPILKSPRECKSLLVNTDALKYHVFLCDSGKQSIAGTHALEYIRWGETHKVHVGSRKLDGFHQVTTVLGRNLWYKLDADQGNLFWVKETNDTLATYTTKDPIFADCRLYYATGSNQLKQYTNSTLFHLFSETQTRSGLGLGARSLMVYEVGDLFCLNDVELQNLKDLPDFNEKNIQNIFTECGIDPEHCAMTIEEQDPKPLPYRKLLDDAVFDILNLTEEERKDVYRGVCRLVWNRLSKARSV